MSGARNKDSTSPAFELFECRRWEDETLRRYLRWAWCLRIRQGTSRTFVTGNWESFHDRQRQVQAGPYRAWELYDKESARASRSCIGARSPTTRMSKLNMRSTRGCGGGNVLEESRPQQKLLRRSRRNEQRALGAWFEIQRAAEKSSRAGLILSIQKLPKPLMRLEVGHDGGALQGQGCSVPFAEVLKLYTAATSRQTYELGDWMWKHRQKKGEVPSRPPKISGRQSRCGLSWNPADCTNYRVALSIFCRNPNSIGRNEHANLDRYPRAGPYGFEHERYGGVRIERAGSKPGTTASPALKIESPSSAKAWMILSLPNGIGSGAL